MYDGRKASDIIRAVNPRRCAIHYPELLMFERNLLQKVLRAAGVSLLLMAACAAHAARAADAVTNVGLYALDCGHIRFKDMALFADTGEYDGKVGELAPPCDPAFAAGFQVTAEISRLSRLGQ
jgi:hypothetical protein